MHRVMNENRNVVRIKPDIINTKEADRDERVEEEETYQRKKDIQSRKRP